MTQRQLTILVGLVMVQVACVLVIAAVLLLR